MPLTRGETGEQCPLDVEVELSNSTCKGDIELRVCPTMGGVSNHSLPSGVDSPEQGAVSVPSSPTLYVLELRLRLTPRADLNKGSSNAIPWLSTPLPCSAEYLFVIEQKDGDAKPEEAVESMALPVSSFR